MSKNIVFEGWLTKSPPNRRIWRTVSSTLAWHFTFVDRRWRRRWFALRQSGELPGQYFLDYYADRNCRRLKGTIDLDQCEQVDAGLHMERQGQAPCNTNMRGSVFTIQTQRRTYHLEAECEQEMEKWVDAICRVCGLRATESSTRTPARTRVQEPYENNTTATTAFNDHYECADGTGPYIPISECITGVRAQDEQRAFTFDTKNIVVSTRPEGQQYTSQPHIRINSELSENDSNMSDEDDGSLHASHQNLTEWAVTKSFTKLAVSPKKNGSEDGPPVPPRPPKTFATRPREVVPKEIFQGPKIQEPVEFPDNAQQGQIRRTQRRMSQGAPASPRPLVIPVIRCPEEEEEFSPGHASLQYCNLPSLPPAVDRALKPRHSSHSIGHINSIMAQYTERLPKERSPTDRSPEHHCKHCTCKSRRVPLELSTLSVIIENEAPQLPPKNEQLVPPEVPSRSLKPRRGGLKLADEMKPDVLQYLDLDLHTSKPPQGQQARKPVEIAHGKSMSSVDTNAYKTVDFLKTEAFNITRQDAEASRNCQH
ncbi:uncharacterized protein LOC110373862 isoform X3 [Helicoverpa armigera]|uniref:uncharacterized protein LOC110373862 isoform X3 n=1 Tax=Helicoverpa armigera TaxID=29058 RepID=UPI003082907A